MAIPPAWADETLIVCDGTTTNAYVPYCSEYALSSATNMTSQMIYLPSNLSGLPTGATIKSITFYGMVNIPSKIYNRRFVVRMGETTLTAVTEATLNNRSLIDNQVFGGEYGDTPAYSGTAMTFTFDNGYVWNGGNLAIELYCSSTNNSSDQSYYWYGISAPAASSGFHRVRNNSNNNYLQAFLPKMTITYEGGSVAPTIEISPESLTINDSGSDNVFTVTGSNIDGNINASLGNNTDWYLNPTSFSNAGGETGVTYTGRALSASNTVTATAANDATVTASATVNYVADLYIVTDNGQTGNWDFTNGTHMTNNNGTYTATFTANADNTFILFARKLGDGVNWNTRLVFGPNSNGDWVWGDNTAGTIDLNDDDPIKLPNAGTYNITINSDGTFSITTVQPQVATPTFSPAEGTFTEAQTVTISCATDGATISYSTDGGNTWTQGNSLTVSETTTVMAKAAKSGMTDSEIASATYTINTPSGQTGEVTVGDASTYTYQLPAYYPSYYAQTNQMIYPGSQLDELVGNDITGIKFYTREGTTMNFSGTYSVALGVTDQVSYSSATPISSLTAVVTEHVATTGVTEFEIEFDTPFRYDGGNLVVQFQVNNPAPNNFTNTYWAGTDMGYNVGYYSQYSGLIQILPKATFTYASSTPSVATPTFTPEAGTYNSVQEVSISCATDGATISYSTDGGNTWTPYNGPITVSETTTIMARAEKDGMTTSEASAEYVIDIPEDYAVTVSPDGGTIDFGTVDNEAGATKSKTITITNIGLNPVTPTLGALTAPYSTDYTPTQIQPGESVTITITFTPTEEGTFNSQATLSFGNGIADRTFTLTGKGGQYDENDHSEIYDHNYTWTDANGQPHTNNLLETATDPDQIIAMLREVYTNKQIPGNKVRGYTESLAPESLMVNGDDAFAVNYSAVGQLNSSLEYVDQYGWNIPTNKAIKSVTKGSSTYRYMDPTEYTPNEEGVTLIMIELKDGANYSGDEDYYSFGSSALSLHDKVANTFKSARIITTWKHSGSGEEAGTLFKIDANKLNRYFFLAKGQLRLIDHAQSYESNWTGTNVVPFPSLKGSTFTDNSFNSSAGGAVLSPFEHMFEQFSPNQAVSSTSAMTDVYQELINMESFPVIHDCVSIPYVGGNHEFNMYGVDSESDDCQDVRDMMFFVPDYRMKFWRVTQYSFGDDIRDPNTIERFVNYNRDHQPTLGLYVIRQNEITGEKQADANVYDLHLSWESNLLDFLPGDEAQYQLFRVVTNADGTKSYTPVEGAVLEPNQTTYVDHVAMQETGQEVTYVVQGQDATQFLSLQMSNEESFIIPGTDETLKLTLKLTNDYSRFDPKTERNYYSNELQVTNNMSPYVSADDLAANNAKFIIYRYYGEGENEVGTPVATLTPVAGQMKLNITWANQRDNSTDAENYYSWINMPNADNVTYSVNNNVVAFDNFRLFDNFYESVADNNHPSQYRYQVEFSYGDQTAHSNKVSVYIHKTDMDVKGYTQSNIDNDDLDHSLNTTSRFIDEQVKYSSKQEILRYDAFRWKEDSENERKIMTNSTIDAATLVVTDAEVAPTGEADNGGSQYTLKMDGITQGSVDINMDGNSTATFEDFIVNQEAGMYYYAPVVETFTGRSDYNTYGAPVQQTGVATIQAKVAEAIISTGSFKVGDKPRLYAHYNVTLDLSQLLIPSEDDPFKDYDLYKVRVWRQVDPSLLNEEVFTGNKVGRNRAERITGDFLMEEVDYNTFSRSAVDNEHQTSLYKLGSNTNLTKFHSNWTLSGSNEIMGTFGAVKLRTTVAEGDSVIDELPMHFIVRAYYTRTANIPEVNTSGAKLSNRGVDVAEDQKYYIAEYEFTHTLTRENIVTGIPSVVVDRNVSGVTYFNVMGQQSDKPFEGINIVVTHYSDGTTSTTKVLK
ncbi:MAG: chitobiase/beta-hexosaminidase C-terminal domain-containing protein [Muribaculaceae bacterium]|nr:chitobiase/beta-hexosaminidase C-terminal domain-containing protein [Muribaculaceae bacterium]